MVTGLSGLLGVTRVHLDGHWFVRTVGGDESGHIATWRLGVFPYVPVSGRTGRFRMMHVAWIPATGAEAASCSPFCIFFGTTHHTVGHHDSVTVSLPTIHTCPA
jgi:hypothetical protein